MSKQTETLTDPTRRDFLGTASGAGAMLATLRLPDPLMRKVLMYL